MTTLDEIQQAVEGAKVCPDCGRPYAASYPLWQCSDTTCGLSVEWNEDGENHEDCINECLYATKKHLCEALAAQTEKAARAEQESATACARMRVQKADLRSRIAELEAALGRAERENEAWRALAEWRSNWHAQELSEFGKYESGKRYVHAQSYKGDPIRGLGETVQAAAIDLAEKLGLIAGGKTNG